MSNSKTKIPKEQVKKCNIIIHGASSAAGAAGAGLAQIPLADSALITPIQVGMIIALGKVFDQKVSKTAAQAIISSASASLVGRGVSQLLIGWIPGVGNAINTATAAGITEAIGWIAVKNFSNNSYADIVDYKEDDNSSVNINEEENLVSEDIADDKNDVQIEKIKEELRSYINNEKDREGGDSEQFNSLMNKVEKLLEHVDDDELTELYSKIWLV